MELMTWVAGNRKGIPYLKSAWSIFSGGDSSSFRSPRYWVNQTEEENSRRGLMRVLSTGIMKEEDQLIVLWSRLEARALALHIMEWMWVLRCKAESYHTPYHTCWELLTEKNKHREGRGCAWLSTQLTFPWQVLLTPYHAWYVDTWWWFSVYDSVLPEGHWNAMN